MADQKPTSTYYQNMGGINQKASQYEMSTAQFLDLRNLDFDVPKALQKRPGSTFGIGSSNGTSGPVQTLYEFSKLTGESFIMVASDTALFYVAANAYTLLEGGWNNGQPPDMVTFVNKLWIANGQKFEWWDGSTILPAGLPTSPDVPPSESGLTHLRVKNNAGPAGAGVTWMLVAGATFLKANTGSYNTRGVYVAYSYVRSDGYQGPADFLKSANNIVFGRDLNTNGAEFFNTYQTVGGFTVPPGRGITAISLWVATDSIAAGATTGNLGYRVLVGSPQYYDMSVTLLPGADLSRFHLFTTIPISSLFSAGGYYDFTLATNVSMLSTTFIPQLFTDYASVATGAQGFSGMNSDYFTTYIPKYIELNQNSMFYAGFSSYPSTVTFSEVGTPETVMPESNFEVRTNDGDRVTGMMALNNQLLVFKEKSFHKLIGDSADNYQLIQLSTDYGCLSQRTCLTIDQSAYWLDKKGILEYTGANWSIMSGAIEGVFRRMNVSAAKEKATSVHHIYRNQIWFGIPVDGSTINNLTVVYDYLVNAWTFFDGYNPSAYAYIKGALTRPTAWRGDYSGMIHYTGESFMADSSQGMTCLALTRFENEGGENQTTIWRRFFLDVATVTGASTPINGRVFSNYNLATVQSTFAIYQGQFQTRAELGVVGKAISVQLSTFSATMPLLINGYSWAKRGLRNV